LAAANVARRSKGAVMETCTKCGKEYDDSFTFCPHCAEPKMHPAQPTATSPAAPQAQPQIATQVAAPSPAQPQESPLAPHPEVPGRKRGKLKWVLIAAGCAIVVAAIIIVAIFAFGSKHPSSSSTITAPAANTPSTYTPSTNALKEWGNKYMPMARTIGLDVDTMTTDGKNGSLSAVSADAQKLIADITTAQSYPAIPDAQAAADFSTALAEFKAAAQGMLNGINNNDTSLFSQAATELNSGMDSLAKVITDIQNAQ